MRWKWRRQSSNIEDRRGTPSGRRSNPFGRGGIRLPRGGGGGRRVSGGGITMVVLLVVGYVVLKALGIDPMLLLEGGGLAPVNEQVVVPGGEQLSPQRQDEMTQFVATVLAETEDTWGGIFSASGVILRLTDTGSARGVANRCWAWFTMENRGGFLRERLFSRDRTFRAMTCVAQRAGARMRIRRGGFLPLR